MNLLYDEKQSKTRTFDRLIIDTDPSPFETSRENFKLFSTNRSNSILSSLLVLDGTIINTENTPQVIKKSKKIGTLLLIGIISLCGIITAITLPTPWSLMAIGFGGPLVTLIKRLFN